MENSPTWTRCHKTGGYVTHMTLFQEKIRCSISLTALCETNYIVAVTYAAVLFSVIIYALQLRLYKGEALYIFVCINCLTTYSKVN